MRPVSDRFLRTLRGSHRMVAQARVVAPGLTGVDPAGVEIPILAGDVRMDGTAQVRSTVDLSTLAAWPSRATDLLAPYGAELHVRRGIRYGDGGIEWVSLGYHRLEAVEQPDAPRGPIRITARDRMAGIVDARLTAPRQFAATTTYGAVLAALVAEVYPWAVIEWDDPAVRDRPIGRQIIAEEDRYAVCHDVVTSTGRVWWWDHRGVLVVRLPVASVDPVWTVDHGQGGVLVSLSRQLSREGVYNGVVATGEGADMETPVRAVAVDANPASPTRWGGPFGLVPRFYSSPLITDASQAVVAAESMLRRYLGLPYSADLTAVPNPALEPVDPIRVRYPGRSETHVVETLTVPLVAESAMPATTREQTTILIGDVT